MYFLKLLVHIRLLFIAAMNHSVSKDILHLTKRESIITNFIISIIVKTWY